MIRPLSSAHDAGSPPASWPRMLFMRRSYTVVVVIWIAELIGLYALQRYFS